MKKFETGMVLDIGRRVRVAIRAENSIAVQSIEPPDYELAWFYIETDKERNSERILFQGTYIYPA